MRGFKASTRNNNLSSGANRDGAIYRPDIIVRNSAGEIVWLVEVETSQGGKAAVGAAILADICMKKTDVTAKPKLLFVFYRSGSNLELAEKRFRALRERINNVELLAPVDENRAFKMIISP